MARAPTWDAQQRRRLSFCRSHAHRRCGEQRSAIYLAIHPASDGLADSGSLSHSSPRSGTTVAARALTGEPETTALPSSRSSTAGLALTAVVLLAACTSPGTTRATRSPSASAPPAATASVPPSPSAPLASPSGALAPIAPTFEGPVPAGFAPLSATFVSALDGFVLGEAPCGAATCTELAGTTDAGWSWERVNPRAWRCRS
jgi:hypothetical protein